MTAFVRRVPAVFDETYWRVAEGYMERDLGAVDAAEAERHEAPKGFASVAGETTGQRKDQPYCFAPYDGLRGLGMPDFQESVEGEETVEVAPPMPMRRRRLPSLGETAGGQSPAKESALLNAVPYVVAAAGLLYLLNQTAKQTSPSRAR